MATSKEEKSEYEESRISLKDIPSELMNKLEKICLISNLTVDELVKIAFLHELEMIHESGVQFFFEDYEDIIIRYRTDRLFDDYAADSDEDAGKDHELTQSEEDT